MTFNEGRIRLGLTPQDGGDGDYLAIPVRSRTRRILSYLRHAGGRLKH